MAAHSSIWIEKFDRAERIFDRLIAAAREASAVSALIYPLAARSQLDYRLGRWAAARAARRRVGRARARHRASCALLALGLAAARPGRGRTRRRRRTAAATSPRASR